MYIFQRICFNCDICESLIIVVKRIVLVTCGFTTTIGMNIVLRCHKIAKNKRKMKFTICNNIFSISLISIAFKHDNSENGRQVHETYFLRFIATMGKSLSDCYISTTKCDLSRLIISFQVIHSTSIINYDIIKQFDNK